MAHIRSGRTQPTDRCSRHPDRIAADRCGYCHTGVCSQCRNQYGTHVFCSTAHRTAWVEGGQRDEAALALEHDLANPIPGCRIAQDEIVAEHLMLFSRGYVFNRRAQTVTVRRYLLLRYLCVSTIQIPFGAITRVWTRERKMPRVTRGGQTREGVVQDVLMTSRRHTGTFTIASFTTGGPESVSLRVIERGSRLEKAIRDMVGRRLE